jgi:hypothetical protein
VAFHILCRTEAQNSIWDESLGMEHSDALQLLLDQ